MHSSPTSAPNPYLRDFLAGGRDPFASAYERRKACVRRYAFGVPDDGALSAIAAHGPIVELGAGTGYWAYLLRQRGVDIVAYDVAPPGGDAPNAHRFEPRLWTTVVRGDVSVVAAHPDRTLFVCWPAWRDPFAVQALATYRGLTLIYVGEPRGGHTADDAFFDTLERDWRLTQRVALPRWPGASDDLTIYRRGGAHKSGPACALGPLRIGQRLNQEESGAERERVDEDSAVDSVPEQRRENTSREYRPG